MKPLKVFLFPDLFPLEKICVQSFLDELENIIPIERIQVDSQHRNYFKTSASHSSAWVIAQDWRYALNFLKASEVREKLIASVFSCLNPQSSLWEAWFQSLKGPLPPNIKLLTHSALSFKFLRELEGIPEVQLETLPLPVPKVLAKEKSSFVVGSFCPFVPESNLHFVLTLAHYFKKESQSVQMKLIGEGPLRNHLINLIQELELQDFVQLVSPQELHFWEKLDVALFFPNRAEQFAPVLIAAAMGSVPICGTQTVQEFSFTDGVNSFLFELEETKAIAEIVLRLKQNPQLVLEVSKRFCQKMQREFSAPALMPRYVNLFSTKPYPTQNFVRCAL